MFTIGRVVFSKRGRDKGLAFVVVKAEGEFVYLADGGLRKLAKPKKKKIKHVQTTHTVLNEINDKIVSNKNVLDADIRKALLPFKRDVCEVKEEVSSLVEE